MQIHCINLPFSQAYIIENAKGLFLIDTGIPHQSKIILDFMEKLGRKDLKLIIITHAHLDHYGNANILKALTGAPIAIHNLDASAMKQGKTNLGNVKGVGHLIKTAMPLISIFMKPQPAQPDLLLNDNDSLNTFGLDAFVLHTPGHTLGSTTIIFQNEYAFVGDLIISTRKPHSQNYFAEDWIAISKSIQKLKKIKPKWIYPGHGEYPIKGTWLQGYKIEYKQGIFET